jgi:hypothetical protein
MSEEKGKEKGKENQANCFEACEIRIERKMPQNGYGSLKTFLIHHLNLHERTLMTRKFIYSYHS